MTMLTTAATPQHRSPYPGEIFLYLGCGSIDDFVTSEVCSLSISVQHSTRVKATAVKTKAKSWELFTRESGEPVFIHLEAPRGTEMTARYLEAQLPELAKITGAALAVELQSHLGVLLGRFRSGDSWLEQVLRFPDPTHYSDLIISLTVQANGVNATSRKAVLASLLTAWTGGDYARQMGWYQERTASRPASSRRAFLEEMNEFRNLAVVSQAALERQIADCPGRAEQ